MKNKIEVIKVKKTLLEKKANDKHRQLVASGRFTSMPSQTANVNTSQTANVNTYNYDVFHKAVTWNIRKVKARYYKPCNDTLEIGVEIVVIAV